MHCPFLDPGLLGRCHLPYPKVFLPMLFSANMLQLSKNARWAPKYGPAAALGRGYVGSVTLQRPSAPHVCRPTTVALSLNKLLSHHPQWILLQTVPFFCTVLAWLPRPCPCPVSPNQPAIAPARTLQASSFPLPAYPRCSLLSRVHLQLATTLYIHNASWRCICHIFAYFQVGCRVLPSSL